MSAGLLLREEHPDPGEQEGILGSSFSDSAPGKPGPGLCLDHPNSGLVPVGNKMLS